MHNVLSQRYLVFRPDIVVVLGFYVPPTAKVIWTRVRPDIGHKLYHRHFFLAGTPWPGTPHLIYKMFYLWDIMENTCKCIFAVV